MDSICLCGTPLLELEPKEMRECRECERVWRVNDAGNGMTPVEKTEVFPEK